MITFILGGLWHGAGLTFVFWGFLHGSALVIHRLWQKTDIKINTFFAWFITFNFINISWVFFRAKDFQEALNILKAMFTYKELLLLSHRIDNVLSQIGADDKLIAIFILALPLAIFFNNSTQLLHDFKPNKKYIIIILVISIISILEMHKVTEFLYFNF